MDQIVTSIGITGFGITRLEAWIIPQILNFEAPAAERDIAVGLAD